MHLKTLPAFYPLHACKQNHFSHVQLCMTLWTVAHQAPLSMGFSRRVYWSGLPYPSPGFTHYPVPKLLLHIQVVVTAASHFSVPKSVLISLSSKSLQSCPTLCTVARQVPLSMGIFQARILEWIAMPSSMGSSQPGVEPASLTSPALAGGFFTTSATWEALELGLL